MIAATIDEYKQGNFEIGGLWDKQPVLSILSEDLKVLAEFVLDKDRYLINNYFIDERGLWISMDHPRSNDINENVMKFRGFLLE